MGSATECIRWTDYTSSVSASFHQFWQDELFTDVTLAVPGGAPMAAHRAVLAARSAELRRLLSPAEPCDQPERPVLLLRGVTADQLRLLLQLLYTGRARAGADQLHELVNLCRELGVEGVGSDSLCPLSDAGDSETGQTMGTPQPPPAGPGTPSPAVLPEAGMPSAETAAAVKTLEELDAAASALEAAVESGAAAVAIGDTAAEAAAAAAIGDTAAEAAAAAAIGDTAAEAAAAERAGERIGLAAGGGACWLPSVRPRSPAAGGPRSYTPVTDRVDSDGEGETAAACRDRLFSVSSEEVSETAYSQERDARPCWEPAVEPLEGADAAAAFRHLSSLLETLGRRRLLRLRERADQIMHPDFTRWLPDELMVHILSRLSPRDLLVAAGTCRRWQALAEDDSVWRRCLRLNGVPPPPAASSRLMCVRYLSWTELPLPAPKRLKGHESVIRCMAVDGDRIVTGSSDKTVGVWSASSGVLQCRLRCQSEVTCVQVEGDTVVSAARDCTIGVWDAATGQRRHRLCGHEGIVWSVALSGGRAASGSDDKTVRLWDVVTGGDSVILRGHETVVRAVCFDGQRVVSGDDAGCVQVWSLESGGVEVAWQARSRYVMVLQHAHELVVSGHGDGAIHVWDLTTRRLRHELRSHAGWVTDLALSADGLLLLSGCKDGTAILWNLDTGALRHSLSGGQGHRQRVTSVRLLPGLAVTGSRDGRVKLWDTGSGAPVRDLVSPEVSGGPVKHVWVGADRLVCGVQNNASDRPQVLVMEMGPRAELLR